MSALTEITKANVTALATTVPASILRPIFSSVSF